MFTPLLFLCCTQGFQGFDEPLLREGLLLLVQEPQIQGAHQLRLPQALLQRCLVHRHQPGGIGFRVPQLCGEEGYTTTERRWARPTLDVNGFCSGFIGEGAKTVLPAKAMAKISCRLVPDQDHEEIAKMMDAEIRRLAPPTVEVKVSFHHGGPAWMNNPDHPINEAARKAYRRAWHAEPVLMREGGSIAIVSDFCNTLNIPAILMGVGLDSDNIHAPNEHLTLSDFHAGIAASAFLMEELSELEGWER